MLLSEDGAELAVAGDELRERDDAAARLGRLAHRGKETAAVGAERDDADDTARARDGREYAVLETVVGARSRREDVGAAP